MAQPNACTALVVALSLMLGACSGASPTPSPAPTEPPTAAANACTIAVEPAVQAPGGWAFVVGSGFREGERLTWSSAAEDGTLSATWDSDSFDQMRPDSRGGFGMGLGAPGQEGVGHTITATISSATCSASATWRIESENEQTRPLPAVQPVACSAERVSADRTDDSAEHQVHVIYALPPDATDRSLDTNGRIAAGIEHIDTFLRAHLDGSSLRFDTCNGELDVTFLEMPRSGREYAAMRNGFTQGLELDLARAGFRYGTKLYVVVWDGLAQWARLDDGCGGEAGFHGVATLFLRTMTGETCPLLGVEEPIGEPDTGLAHEVVHVLGLPAQCGANVDEIGHVTDATTDLMYGIGHLPANQIDASHDDYYLHEIAGCPDLADSAFLDPLPANPELPADWPAESAD